MATAQLALGLQPRGLPRAFCVEVDGSLVMVKISKCLKHCDVVCCHVLPLDTHGPHALV